MGKLMVTQNVSCCAEVQSHSILKSKTVHHGCILKPILFFLLIGDVLHDALPRRRGRVQWAMTFSSIPLTTLTASVCSLTGSWNRL